MVVGRVLRRGRVQPLFEPRPVFAYDARLSAVAWATRNGQRRRTIHLWAGHPGPPITHSGWLGLDRPLGRRLPCQLACRLAWVGGRPDSGLGFVGSASPPRVAHRLGLLDLPGPAPRRPGVRRGERFGGLKPRVRCRRGCPPRVIFWRGERPRWTENSPGAIFSPAQTWQPSRTKLLAR